MSKLVSIIVPVFNESDYLDSFFSMINNQTYNNIEVIMIDDGSTDSSWEVMKSKSSSKNFKMYHQKNMGVSAARNKGLCNSRGEYLIFADADDQFEKNYVERLVGAVEQSTAQLVSCGYTEYDELNGERFRHTSENESEELNDAVVRIVTHHVMCSALWNKIFLASIVRENHIVFNDGLAVGEDLLFLIEYITCIKKWCEIADVLYHYQISDSGTMQDYKSDTNFNKKWLTEWYALKIATQELSVPVNNYKFETSVLTDKKLRVAIKILGRSKKMGYKNKDILEMRRYVRKRYFRVLTDKAFSQKQRLKALIVCL